MSSFFIGACGFGYLALSSHWAYSVAIAGLIGGWSLIRRMRWRCQHRRHLDALRAAFGPSERPVPHLKEESSYGFPHFTLTFVSEAELRHAEDSGNIAAFKEAIQSLYAHTGSKQNPFDVDWAVWVTCEGWKPCVTT
jgi:hypothetical protein